MSQKCLKCDLLAKIEPETFRIEVWIVKPHGFLSETVGFENCLIILKISKYEVEIKLKLFFVKV